MKELKTRYDILVIRIGADGTIYDSSPCDFCVNMMLRYNIQNVYYSDGKGHIVMNKVKDLGNKYKTGVTNKIIKQIPFKTLALVK